MAHTPFTRLPARTLQSQYSTDEGHPELDLSDLELELQLLVTQGGLAWSICCGMARGLGHGKDESAHRLLESCRRHQSRHASQLLIKKKVSFHYNPHCSAVEEDIPITDPAFYSSQVLCPDSLISYIFRPTPACSETMPMLHERIAIMREVGYTLCNVGNPSPPSVTAVRTQKNNY